MNKKALSAIIATILLILIGIVAAVTVFTVVVPMVRESLRGGVNCFKTLDKLKIIDTEYTCYDEDEKQAGVTIKLEEIEIEGIAIIVESKGNSERFEVYEDKEDENIKMSDKDFGEKLEIPKQGEERTYIVKFDSVENLEIAPILDKVCDAVDSIKLKTCT